MTVSARAFAVKLFLPSQAATENEATIIAWHVAEGDSFEKGQSLAEVESAKSTFDFEAPCSGTVSKLLFKPNASASFEEPVMEVMTSDESMKEAIRHAGESESAAAEPQMNIAPTIQAHPAPSGAIGLLAVDGYLPERIVPNAELLKQFPDMTEEYLFGVTGIRQRHWAAPNETPSDMAAQAARRVIQKAGIKPESIGAIVLATTTPDVVMPSTACILQDKLGLYGIPAFDLNAACSGWLYGISVAKGLIKSEIADNILVVSVDMQSRLLDFTDKGTCFLFGDGAGATIVSSNAPHTIKSEIMLADAKGLPMAGRLYPGYRIASSIEDFDPYVRLDGHAMFRFATGSFSTIIENIIAKSQWQTSDVRWVVPHQANGRILKAVAKKSGIPFERIYLNIDHVGNTSAASIPLALIEIERGLQRGDKLVFASVGAGVTAAALSLEW
jgi:3-oxoacyl-[acyl-carrier-protein] synthase-3